MLALLPTVARVLTHPAVLAVLAWLERSRLYQVAMHLTTVKPALARWEAWAVAFGAALVPEPSPAGEIILLVMAVYLFARRRRLMFALWCAACVAAGRPSPALARIAAMARYHGGWWRLRVRHVRMAVAR